MHTALNIVQIVISVLLIIVILFQVKGGGIGGIFGQADSVYRTKRGVERWLFWATIILSAIFIILALATIVAG
ncbi:MAG: preprotein translocase subunit SecG [Dehalococcoidales bacterium]|jgi:preprotein translocase subunit SecG|nr:preprotein translocase subunit SecG [Dehalococcoidales bacterium]